MKRLKVTRIARPVELPVPEVRGELLTDADVARLLKLEHPEKASVRKWVRTHVPKKKRLGHNTCRWFAADVLEWVASTGTDA